MDLTTLAILSNKYIVPSFIAIGTFFLGLFGRVKGWGFKTKEQEEGFLEKEWSRVNAIREHFDGRITLILDENKKLQHRVMALQERIAALELEVSKLSHENEALREELAKHV